MDLTLAIIIIIILVVIGLIIFYNYREEKKLRPIREKIDAYRQSGQPLMREHEVPLTASEAARIRSAQGLGTWGIAFVIILLFGGVAWFLITIELDVYLVAAGFIAVTGFWIMNRIQYHRNIRDKIASGNKTIVRGIITKRYEDGDESSTYHIEVDAIEFTVEKSIYEKYQLGDAAEFHIFKPYSNFVLYDKRLEGAGLTDLKNLSADRQV